MCMHALTSSNWYMLKMLILLTLIGYNWVWLETRWKSSPKDWSWRGGEWISRTVGAVVEGGKDEYKRSIESLLWHVFCWSWYCIKCKDIYSSYHNSLCTCRPPTRQHFCSTWWPRILKLRRNSISRFDQFSGTGLNPHQKISPRYLISKDA